MNEWQNNEGVWSKEVHTQHESCLLKVEQEGRIWKWEVYSREMEDTVFFGEEEMLELALLKARINAYKATLSDEDW